MAWLRALLVLPLALGLLGLAVRAEGDVDEVEPVRPVTEKWQSDPEHHARLVRSLKEFLALAPERREQLRTLDRELNAAPDSARLHRVLERYHDWLEALPAAEREHVVSAATPKERLQRIKAIRQRQWVERLPLAYREELALLTPERKSARIAELKKDEKTRRSEWRIALRHWNEIQQQNPRQQFFAVRKAVEEAVQGRLLPKLSAAEKAQLVEARGKGLPEFPRAIIELADKHNVELPGAPAMWDNFRKRLPEVPNWKLQDFLRNELTRDQRMALPSLNVNDPETRTRLKRLFFEKHPEELVRLQRVEQKKGKKVK